MNDNNSNILIIGGTRYHGYFTLKTLLKEGFKVTTITRSKFKEINSNHTHLCFDRNNTDKVIAILKSKNFHTIIDNCCYSVNQIKPILEEINKSGAHYIFSSTVMAYLSDIERSPEVELIPNKEKYKSKRPSIKKFGYSDNEINYAINKRKCEDYIRLKLKNYSILRIHNVIDLNDFTNKSYNFIEWLINVGIKHKDSYIQIADKQDIFNAIRTSMDSLYSSDIINIAKPKIRISCLIKKINEQYKSQDKKMINSKSPIPINVVMKVDSDLSNSENAENYLNLFKNIYRENLISLNTKNLS